MLTQPVSFITTALIILIVASFAVGAYQVNKQAQQISEIARRQSPLIFAFENTSRTMTTVVFCTRGDDSRYVCLTEQYDREGRLISSSTPVPAPN